MAGMLDSSKETLLKKQLIRSGAVTAVLLGILLAAGYALSDYAATTIASQNTRKSQNSSLSAQAREIKTMLGQQSVTAGFYNKYVSNHNPSFVINREAMMKILASLRTKYHMSSLDVTISSVSKISQKTVSLKSGSPIKSTVHITLGALTDNTVYNFIYDLQHKLPGIVAITSLKLTKSAPLTKKMAEAAIAEHNIMPLVTGDVSFAWIGIAPHAKSAHSHAPGGFFPHAR